MTLGILTTVWQRPELTALFLRYWSELQVDGIDFVNVAVVSPGEDASVNLYKDFPDWIRVNAKNDPLSDKWNVGMVAMQKHEPDAVLVLGSDNFVDAAFLREAASLLEAGAEYIKPNGWYIYELMRQECCWLYALGVGAGRVLSASALDRCGWRPWRKNKHHAPDAAMDFVLERELGLTAEILDISPARKGENGILLDLKDPDQYARRSYDKYKRNLGQAVINHKRLLADNFPALEDDCLGWPERKAKIVESLKPKKRTRKKPARKAPAPEPTEA